MFWKETTDARPGEVVLCDPRRLVVAAGEGLLSIRQLQLEGKKRMDVETFLRGYSVKRGRNTGRVSFPQSCCYVRKRVNLYVLYALF